MGGVTSNRGYPYPSRGDNTDISRYFQNLAQSVDVDVQGVASGINAAALLALLLGGAASVPTQISGNATLTAAAADAPMTVASAVVGHSFVVPPSGLVLLLWGASVSTSIASGSTVFMATEVAEGNVVGSGAVLSGATDAQSTQDDGTADRGTSKQRVVTSGLTPGDVVNVYIKWRQTGTSTVTARNPYVHSVPLLG